FPGVDAVLGPEMKSTGEVMGIDRDFRKAYLKSQIAAGSALPTSGKVFISVKNRDKRVVMTLAKSLVEMGFSLVATAGTARVLEPHGMAGARAPKVAQGYGLTVIELMRRGESARLCNTPEDLRAPHHSCLHRLAVLMLDVHASGGVAMMRAAAEAARKAAQDFAVPRPLVLGVTVLTSLDRRALQREVGVSSSVDAHVLHLADRAREAGLDGCVASPREIRTLRVALGPEWVIVTPGIRISSPEE